MNFDEGLEPAELAAAIGERLRKFREEHGLSQSEVAERTGISRGAINRYELGKMLPTLRQFGIVIRYMDADAHWMLFGASEDPKSLIKDRLLLKLFLAIQASDPDTQRWLIDLVAAFLQNGKDARKAQFAKLFDEL